MQKPSLFVSNSKTISFPVKTYPLESIASQICKKRTPERRADYPNSSAVSVGENFFQCRMSISLVSSNTFCINRDGKYRGPHVTRVNTKGGNICVPSYLARGLVLIS